MQDETNIELEVKPEEEAIEAEAINPDSSQEKIETEDDSEEEESEEETISEPVKTIEIPSDGLTAISGETPREHALRLEIKRLRDDKTKERTKEIFEPNVVGPKIKIESEILKRYRPEEIQSLREVLPELAKELGYVRKDELSASTYEEKANEQIESFIQAHPEYSAEKDPDSILWNKLKSEYTSVYKPPQNPKDFKKIFERIHKDIFNIQASEPLPKIAAANERVKVASHSGPSSSNALHNSKASNGFRFDALKGFSDEDIAELQGQAGE